MNREPPRESLVDRDEPLALDSSRVTVSAVRVPEAPTQKAGAPVGRVSTESARRLAGFLPTIDPIYESDFRSEIHFLAGGWFR